MTRDLSALSARTFDLAIIGGGITGACIAHDASLRGLSVALVVKDDFGGATSAAASKLLHGGIRCLQQTQLLKVRESAAERAAFLRIAPHLIRRVPFLLPTSRSFSRGSPLLGAGIAALPRPLRRHWPGRGVPARAGKPLFAPRPLRSWPTRSRFVSLCFDFGHARALCRRNT